MNFGNANQVRLEKFHERCSRRVAREIKRKLEVKRREIRQLEAAERRKVRQLEAVKRRRPPTCGCGICQKCSHRARMRERRARLKIITSRPWLSEVEAVVVELMHPKNMWDAFRDLGMI